MLRTTTVLSLLLACAVSLSSSAVILDDGAPVFWTQTTDKLIDLPAQEGILTPDPWHYLQRMTFYRLVIAATDPLMGSMGTGATDSPLWGLPLQLSWMLSSRRLADPTGATTCGLDGGDTMCISTQSWWGCQNYFTSSLPFLSAAKQGFLGQDISIKMTMPEGVTDYCTTYDDCSTQYPDAMSKWDAFFQGVKASTDSPLPENEKKDALLGLYWQAQMASTYASAACDAKKSQYSTPEQNFLNSWLNAAEYVSAAYFQSSLENSRVFMEPLPGRVLVEADSPPNIADMTAEENHTLRVFNWMTYIDSVLNGSLVRTWKNAMCSVATREKGREMLGQLLLNPAYATTTFMSVITGLGSC